MNFEPYFSVFSRIFPYTNQLGSLLCVCVLCIKLVFRPGLRMVPGYQGCCWPMSLPQGQPIEFDGSGLRLVSLKDMAAIPQLPLAFFFSVAPVDAPCPLSTEALPCVEIFA